MKITTFKNMKGLIHGSDPKRIGCDSPGVLRIGKTAINVEAGEEAIMPMLFNGSTGNYDSTFTEKGGEVYDLGKTAVKNGWIQPPHPTAVELMELRCRADRAEARIEELSNIFDTNSLNFLI
jgi:hypothetical protein